MTKKSRIILAIFIFILGFACKPKPEQPVTTTTGGGTSTTNTIAPPPPPHEIDHYKIWKVTSVRYERPVHLRGQFDDGPWGASVRSIEYLGNPVQKNDEKILKADWHLVGYSIKAPPQPPRTVIIDNQFQKGVTLQITDAAWLLLPASKSLQGQPAEPPKEADHYVCYTVPQADSIDVKVTLMDQFDRRRDHGPEQIHRLQPAYFCVPVSKDDGPVYKGKEHLTVYRLDTPTKYSVTAATWDQFGQRKLTAEQSEYLAVPTFKTWKKPQS